MATQVWRRWSAALTAGGGVVTDLRGSLARSAHPGRGIGTGWGYLPECR